MEPQDRRPKQRTLFARLRRYIKAREFEFKFAGTGIPTRVLHPLLSDEAMRNKIRGPLKFHLESHGFKETEDQWMWVRARTAWINDYIFAPLLTKSAPELYGINLYAGIQCPPIARLRSELSGDRHELTRLLLRPLIHIPYLPNKQIPSRWNFWNKAFDDEEVDDMLWYLERYALPFLESFSTLDDLVLGLDKYAPLFQREPENVAAILAFAGRFDEAQQRLEEGLHTVKGMSVGQINIINAMIAALQNNTLQTCINKILQWDNSKEPKILKF